MQVIQSYSPNDNFFMRVLSIVPNPRYERTIPKVMGNEKKNNHARGNRRRKDLAKRKLKKKKYKRKRPVVVICNM